MILNLKRLILISILRCGGLPMPVDALISGVQLMCLPAKPTRTDVDLEIHALERSGLVSGLSDEVTGESWSLTEAGKHKASQL